MKLLISATIAPEVESFLGEHAPDIEVVQANAQGEIEGDAHDAEVIATWWTPRPAYQRMLTAAPNLRWIHVPSAGVDTVLVPELGENVIVTNSAGVHAIPIAEFVIMTMLNHTKRARDLYGLTPANAWPVGKALQLNELYEKTVVILGLGGIGREIARRCAAFGMRVLGSRRRPAPVEYVDRVVGDAEWHELLPEADYLVLAMPLTSETRGMINAEALALLKPEAYLINIARGQVVDTPALMTALEEGQLAGATLDTLPQEPLPEDHPLWHVPNVWITPHISAMTPRTRERILAVFFENLLRYRAGQPLLNVVDRQAGY